jgi:hypothetical protein
MKQTPRQRKLFVLARELNLTEDERHEFAGEILQRDVTSWADLSDEDVERVLDGLHGAQAFIELMRQRIRAR